MTGINRRIGPAGTSLRTVVATGGATLLVATWRSQASCQVTVLSN